MLRISTKKTTIETKKPEKKKVTAKKVVEKVVKKIEKKETIPSSIAPEMREVLNDRKKPHFLLRMFWFVFFLALVGAGFYFVNRNEVALERTIVTESPLSTSLEITGKVVPEESATLSFERTGIVSNVSVKGGDKVKEKQNLITVFASDFSTNKLVAEAGLAKAKADLNNLNRGASSEQIALKEEIVASNNETLKATYQGLIETVRTTSSSLDKEIRGNLASLFVYQTGDVYKLSILSCDQIGGGVLENERASIQKQIIAFDDIASGLSNLSSANEIDTAFKTALNVVSASKLFVAGTQEFLNSNCNGKDASLTTIRSTVATSFTTVSTLSVDLQTKNSSLVTQKNAIEQARKDLLVLKAGANVDQRDALLALVSQAEANLSAVSTQESKTKINAPFDGIISKVYVNKGENAQTGSPAVTLLSSSGYQVEGYVREIDVTTLHIGNEVSVTLDAFSKGAFFKGVVTRIDPSPTVQGGVPLYKILVSFVSQDERVRDGMSAKLTMILYKNENALVIPPRFVRVGSDGKVFVKFVNGENVIEKEVIAGNRGDDGQIEITSGLQKGDTLEIADTAARGVQKGTSSGVKVSKKL